MSLLTLNTPFNVKTHLPTMDNPASLHRFPTLGPTLIVAFVLSCGLAAHAQLVADGASYTLDSTSVNLGATNLIIGSNGPNTTFVITNGGWVSDSAQGFIGYNASANNNQAIVSSPGARWNSSAEMYVGYSGSLNNLLITGGGSESNAASGFIGFNSGANNNQATVSGPGSAWNNGSELHVGQAGWFNTLSITNGGSARSTYSAVGWTGANNQAIVSGTNSVWRGSFTMFVGRWGSFNTLSITDGGLVTNDSSYIGWTSGANNNKVIVNGPGSAWNPGFRIYVGNYSSFNTLIITNGGTAKSVYGDIGINVADNNQIIVSGPGSTWYNGLTTIGKNASSSFNLVRIRDGGMVSGAGCYISDNSGTYNQAIVSGTNSVWKNSSFMYIGAGVGQFNSLLITDGGAVSNTIGAIGYLASGNKNQATVSGPGSTWNNSAALYVGRGGLFNTLLITNGGLVQAASATVGYLAGSISNVLVLDNGTLTVPGGLLISSSNTLTGSGTINGIVTDRGTIAPGNPVGKIVLNAPPALQGLVIMEISRNGATLTNDQIQVGGALAFGGSLTVTNIGVDTLAVGDSFQLFSASSYSGGFSSLSLPSLPAGLVWMNQLLVNGSIVVVNQNPPSIGALAQSGTNLIFTFTGGSSGGAWNQLTATNLTLPLASWTTNRSGTLDELGNMTLTNGINGAAPQRYYLISMP